MFPSPQSARYSNERIAGAALAFGLLLGAVGPTILRSAESTGMLFAAWRMLGGAVIYLVIMALRKQSMTLRMLRDATIGGVFFALSIGLFYAAINNTSVTNALIIGALRPALIIAVVGPLMNEAVKASTVAWTAVAIGGAAFAVVAGSQGGGEAGFLGDAIALGATATGAAYLLATKNARKHFDAFSYTTAMMVVGAFVLFPLAAVTGDGTGLPPASDWKWIVAMAVIPGAGHVFNNYSIAHLPLSVVSNATLLIPGLAAFIAWLIIDERILLTDIVGMVITVIALGMVVWTAPAPDLDDEATAGGSSSEPDSREAV